MNIYFEPLNIEENKDLIVSFKADSFSTSFGNADLFYGEDGKGAERYLELLKIRNQLLGSCVHVFLRGNIIGQIELRYITDEVDAGYVNLFYLKSSWRGKGFGKELDAYARNFFLSKSKSKAYLNVSPTNTTAIDFYKKHDWVVVDQIFKSGANVFVMRKDY